MWYRNVSFPLWQPTCRVLLKPAKMLKYIFCFTFILHVAFGQVCSDVNVKMYYLTTVSGSSWMEITPATKQYVAGQVDLYFHGFRWGQSGANFPLQEYNVPWIDEYARSSKRYSVSIEWNVDGAFTSLSQVANNKFSLGDCIVNYLKDEYIINQVNRIIAHDVGISLALYVTSTMYSDITIHAIGPFKQELSRNCMSDKGFNNGLQQIDDLENSNSPIIVYRPDVSSDDNLQYFGAFTSSCISVQQVPLEVHCRGQNLGVCLKQYCVHIAGPAQTALLSNKGRCNRAG